MNWYLTNLTPRSGIEVMGSKIPGLQLHPGSGEHKIDHIIFYLTEISIDMFFFTFALDGMPRI